MSPCTFCALAHKKALPHPPAHLVEATAHEVGLVPAEIQVVGGAEGGDVQKHIPSCLVSLLYPVCVRQ